MSPARLRLDAGTRHVLAWCEACPPWRELRASRASAHLVAADHADQVHADHAAAREHRRRARETAVTLTATRRDTPKTG